MGHRLYNIAINKLFDACTKPYAEYSGSAHETPAPLDYKCYVNGHFATPAAAFKMKGFSMVESWNPSDDVAKRPGFVDVPMLFGKGVGSSFEYKFEGNAVGMFVVGGPRTATIEYSVDGAPYKRINTWTRWSRTLYLPMVYMLERELPDAAHTIKVRIVEGTPGKDELIVRDIFLNNR
jgi:hypothetical protein